MSLVWEDPPVTAGPQGPGRRSIHAGFAELMVQRPGEWARVPTTVATRGSITSLRKQYSKFGQFEYKTAPTEGARFAVWVRYVGPTEPDAPSPPVRSLQAVRPDTDPVVDAARRVVDTMTPPPVGEERITPGSPASAPMYKCGHEGCGRQFGDRMSLRAHRETSHPAKPNPIRRAGE